MNAVLLTGWIVKGGVAYTATKQRKLTFETIVKQPDGEEVPWHCEITEPALIDRCEPLVTPGRTVILQAELAGRIYTQHGVTKGWMRFLAVERAEFPDRSGKKEQVEPEAVKAT